MPPTLFHLQHGRARAEVAAVGAELQGWRDGGRDLLWSGDARWWPRRCPVLFPIVGRLRDSRARIGGRTFEMGIHGFAGQQEFEWRRGGSDQVTLGLASSDTTRRIYPFEFDLELSYRLHDGGLETTMVVANPGTEPLPFALGLHPGFQWPFAAPSADGHAIVFGQAESALVPVISAAGLIAPALRPVPLVQRRLALSAGLFDAEALCFLNARSLGLRFESPDGTAIVVQAQGFAHWALWTRPGAPYLCIEAWTGTPDPDGFDGEFTAKPGMRLLPPGATSAHRVNFCFEPAGGA